MIEWQLFCRPQLPDMRSAAQRFLRSIILVAALHALPQVSAGHAADAGEALYEQHCAVCHGADLGGYIAPALNKTSLTRFTAAQLRYKIMTGGVGTLMASHPSLSERLSKDEIAKVAAFIKNEPQRELSWDMDRIRSSLEVLVEDESALPAKPTYAIAEMDDLMAVMARGHFASGAESKVVFLDGRTNRRLGEVATAFAPHILDYHPTDERWAYVTTDSGHLFKIDLYSLEAVRRVRVGLNGASLAISRDGRFVAAGSYVPHTAVILDAATLEPVRLMKLRGADPDGKMVESDSGVILSTPFADIFVMALEQSGQVWIVDLSDPDFPVTRIEKVGRHLHDAFLSPDGSRLAMASYDDNIIAVIDLERKEVVKRLPAGRQPHVGSGAVIQIGGRTLGIGTNIGTDVSGTFLVTVFDMDTLEVVKQIPVAGPTESPSAHPRAPYIVVDIVGTSPDAAKIQFIDKTTLEVVKTVTVGGHSHFPEYTADGRHLYVSAGYGGNRLVIYDSHSLEQVRTFSMEVPAGIFSHVRARTVAVGLEKRTD